MKSVLEVQNMKCNGCVKAVTDALYAISGITDCSVDLNMATVEVEGDFSIETVVQVLVSAGYPAKVM